MLALVELGRGVDVLTTQWKVGHFVFELCRERCVNLLKLIFELAQSASDVDERNEMKCQEEK